LGQIVPASERTLNNWSALEKANRDYAAAEKLSRRALAIHENALGQDDPNVAVDLNNLAGILLAKGVTLARSRLSGGPWLSMRRRLDRIIPKSQQS